MDTSFVIKAVCAYYKLTPTALMEQTRVAQIVWPRHELMFMLRQQTNLSLAMIGRAVGGRDQTTVKNSLEKVAARIVADPDYAAHIEALERFIDTYAEAAGQPSGASLALARRVIADPLPERRDVERLGLCLLTAASILSSAELTDAEARMAALQVMGGGDHG
jgi:hypothetical protein